MDGVRAQTTRAGREAEVTGVAAWSLVHGYATLWLTGAQPESVGADVTSSAREVARILFTEW